MKKIFTLFLALCGVGTLVAQIGHGGQPHNWNVSESFDASTMVKMPHLDMEEIQAEDAERDQYKEFAYRFGVEYNVNLTAENSGAWETLEDGSRLWRVAISAPDAVAINLRFGQFRLPEGASVFVYDTDKTHFLGSFTRENNKKWGGLAIGNCYADEIVVELHLPNGTPDNWSLQIDQIVHCYRGMKSNFELSNTESNRGPFGNSGACNIGINCPEGVDWQVEKKAVALIASGGFAICSGALVNNTAMDGTPYFLTANHCLGGETNWVFYFHHEAETCSGNSGPTDMSISGSTLKASNGGSDFGLLELSSAPPADWNVQYCGWDNSDDETVTAATGIHHPSGDLKKICHENDSPYHTSQFGAQVWFIDEWEEGVTEEGSSGSPLFDQNHRIIGQLYGGYAACSGSQNNGEADWYGRFGVSWDGASASTRLRDWLDPGNTGVTTLDGWPEGAVQYSYDAAAQNVSNLPESLCSSESVTPEFTLKNNGTEALTSCSISYSYNGNSPANMDWTGNLASGLTEVVTLPSFTPQTGNNTVEIEVSNPNGQSDENNFNNSSSGNFLFSLGETVINLELVTDDYGYETYWEIREPNGTVLASGGNTAVGPNGGGVQAAADTDPGAYANNTTINETIDFYSQGCYEFFIVDDWGDGICCDYGTGSYVITDGNGVTMASGGAFAESEEKVFGMQNGQSVNENNALSFNVFPNPSSGTITLQFTEIPGSKAQLSVVDLTGRVVYSSRVQSQPQAVLELSHLAAGTYHVVIIDNNQQISRVLNLKY